MDPRHTFHLADHARKILVTVERRPCLIDLKRGCSRRHGRAKLARPLENQFEILVQNFSGN